MACNDQKNVCGKDYYTDEAPQAEKMVSAVKLVNLSTENQPVATRVPSMSSTELGEDRCSCKHSIEPQQQAQESPSFGSGLSSPFLHRLSGEKTRIRHTKAQQKERNRGQRFELLSEGQKDGEMSSSSPSLTQPANKHTHSMPTYAHRGERENMMLSHDEYEERIRLLQHSVAETVAQKNALVPPLHSNFRVFSTVLYRMDGKVKKETGSNWETCYMGGAICAERVALTALRVKVIDLSKIDIIGLIIASDAEEFITPGPLCREFLSEYPSINAHTPIMLVNADQAAKVTTLNDLWPHPCHYRGGVQTVEKSEDLDRIPEEQQGFCDLYAQVQLAAIKAECPWYPLSYAAGARLTNGEIKITTSTQALEYGCSLDAMLKLITFLEDYRSKSIEATALLFCDQHGRLHAPFAHARALLSENGYDIPMLVHQDSSLVSTSTFKLYDCDSLDLKSALTSTTSSPVAGDNSP